MMTQLLTFLRQGTGIRIIPVALLFVLLAHGSPHAFAADEIKSRAAVVMDSVTGRILYAKNPDLKLLPASTTKLMTALVVIEKAKLTDVAVVSRRASLAPPTRAGFREGDAVTIETLLYAALMKSANDAAVALAEAVAGSEEKFVDIMNMKAFALGAYDTRFINANGLPGNGQYITAYDLAKIMRHAIKYPVLKEILGTRIAEVSTEKGNSIFIKNTNLLLWSDEDLLGGKTGYTRKAGHCFVCAGERDNETIIVALLGAPHRDLLWKESEELMSFGARVMSKTEEPVVYLTRTSAGKGKAVKAAYRGNDRDPGIKKKLARKTAKGKGREITRKKSTLAKKKAQGKAKAFAKQKKKQQKGDKGLAERKEEKKSDMAKKGGYGSEG